MAAKLLDLKVRGLTSGSATVATQDVEFWDNGTWKFTDAGGNVVIYDGCDPKVNKLLSIVFAGASGLNGRLLLGA